MINLVIEHLTTADMPDSQPLPPFLDDSAIWCVVRRFPNHKTTLWRRISLRTAQPSTAATLLRENLSRQVRNEEP